MATYYDFFSRNVEKDKPIISVPYVDAFGSGNNLHLLIFFFLLSQNTQSLLFLINAYFYEVH